MSSTRTGVGGPRSIALFAALAMFLSMMPVFFAPLPAHAAPAADGNPDLLVAACGLEVLFVIDETGSMNDNTGQETDLENAYTDFATALDGTASTLAVIEFSSYPETYNTADPIPGSPDSARRVTSDYVDPGTIIGYPGGVGNATSTSSYNPGGYTNWQEALWEASLFSASKGYPDLLIFFTDGNPNTVDGGGFGATGNDAAALAAKTHADSLKANGVHMLGIGLGLADGTSSETRLASVTGNEQGTTGSFDIVHDDYILLSDSDEIADALDAVSDQLCNTTINITKWIPGSTAASFNGGTGTGAGFVKDSGWTFDATLSDTSGASWVNGGTPPGATGGSGSVLFKYALDDRGDTADATITETVQNGYGLLGGNCVVTPLNGSAQAAVPFNSNGWTIQNIPDRASVECDVYNQASFLSLNKTVIADDGGNPNESQFNLKAQGNSYGGLVQGNGDQGPALVPADDYVLSESGPDGYTSSGWSCGNAAMNGATVTVPVGAHVICSITNDDIEPRLTLYKDVDSTYGGDAKPGDWTLTATKQGGGDSLQGTHGVSDSVKGGTYNLTESNGPSNYSLDGWSCSNGDDDGTVALASGDDVSCTAYNSADPASLKLVKEVASNDFGASAEASEWNLAANGPGSNDFNGDGTAEDASLPAGNYVLSENGGPSGWAADGEWKCEGGDYNADTDTVTLSIGESATCTITNKAAQPTITLHKDVKSTSGGNATYENFLLKADGPVSISGYNDLGDNGDSSIISAPVSVGTYTLSETANVSGYTAADNWVCIADDGVFDGADEVTLGAGQHADCTITNTDNPASITVRKAVKDSYGGGLEPSNFTLKLDSAVVEHDVTTQVISNTTYVISEDLTGISGYHQDGPVSCIIGDGDPFDLTSGNLQLAEGQHATCTITNVDEPGSITVVKETLPAGSELDFGLFVAAGDGPPLSVDSDEMVDELSAGTYSVGESNDHLGWVQLSLECEDGSGLIETDNGTFDLANGQDVKCTIVNGELPTIEVTKEIANGDPEAEFEFDGDLEGTMGHGDSLGATVEPGEYEVAEVMAESWLLVDIVCDDGAEGIVEAAAAIFDVDYGDHQTCTFINAEKIPEPGTVRVVKDIVSGDPDATFEFAGDISGTIGDGGVLEMTVPVGTTVSSTEGLAEGWSLTGISCVVDSGTGEVTEDLTTRTASATVTSAESVVTCTFANVQDEIQASVLVTVGGACVVEGSDEIGSVDVTISVDNAATVVINDGGSTLATFSQDGSAGATVGATYQWSATANAADNFVFPPGFVSSGEVTVPQCTVPFTGLYADEMALLAGGLLLAGVLALMASRRRREDGLDR